MSQYVPMGNLNAPLDRSVSEEEYAAVLSWMDFCGLTLGYRQELNSATKEMLPDFNFEGII